MPLLTLSGPRRSHALAVLCSSLVVLAPAAALAQPMPGYGHFGGMGSGWDDNRPASVASEPSKKIDVETFRAADAGDTLGHGRIVVTELPGADGDNELDDKLPIYESAVIDQLGRAGYDIANANDPTALVQVSVSHAIIVPEEAPHKKVSGEMSTTVSNRGSGFGMAIAVDLSKPRKAIVGTRMDVRIRDKASGRVLWEGHAEGQAREEEGGLNNTAMANRLANALFRKFPDGKVVAPPAPPAPPPHADR